MRTQKNSKHPVYCKTASVSENNGSNSLARQSSVFRFFLPLAIFCWPILYLFDHVFPLNGYYTGLGNDFVALYYRHKVYLLASLAGFKFPLWSPAEGAGFPFYSNPFSQAFYPLNLLLVVWYKISGGYTVLDHTVFTVLGVSIFALGLYKWLRLINSNLRAVVFSTLVMSVSFKMTEILRFPNAVHSAAWYPWILYAITKIVFGQSLKGSIRDGILLIFSVVCLCTGGYPYYIYYSLFLLLPYMFILLVNPLRLRLFGEREIHWKRAIAILLVSAFVVMLICGPYLLAQKTLTSQTTDRAGKDFEYSTSHIFTFEDTLGSFVYPPAAMQDGWNFFSIAGLLLVFLYLLNGGAVARNYLPAGYYKREATVPLYGSSHWVIRLFFVIWVSLIIYITYGRISYLFIFLWKYMPGFSILRVWARLNIILVPILAWLLSLAYTSFETSISGKTINAAGKYQRLFSPITLLIAIYTVVISVQLHFYLKDIYDICWTLYFKHLSPQRVWFIIYGAAAFAVILIFFVFSKRVKDRPAVYLKAVLIILLLVAVLEMRPVGTKTWTCQRDTQQKRVHLDIALLNKLSFQFSRFDYSFTVPFGPNFSVGIIENWYFNRYVKFLRATQNELPARRVLLGVQDGTKVFFSESIKHETIVSFLRDAGRYRPAGSLLFYNGDELRWKIQAPTAGYLSFIDNWDSDWKAMVDGEPAEIEPLFGTFKSVKLTPGLHYVQFKYQPGILFH